MSLTNYFWIRIHVPRYTYYITCSTKVNGHEEPLLAAPAAFAAAAACPNKC